MNNSNNSKSERPMACVYGPPPPIDNSRRERPMPCVYGPPTVKIARKSKLLIFVVAVLAGAAIAGLLIWLL